MKYKIDVGILFSVIGVASITAGILGGDGIVFFAGYVFAFTGAVFCVLDIRESISTTTVKCFYNGELVYEEKLEDGEVSFSIECDRNIDDIEATKTDLGQIQLKMPGFIKNPT